MSLQPLPSLLATTLLSGRGQANETASANSTADLATGNATAGSVIGVNQSAISVSSPGSVLGTVVAGLSGTAISIAGNADADAGDLSGTSLVGVNGSGSTGFVNISSTGSVQGSLLATLTAAGTSTNGNSDATAGALEAIGIRAGNLSINGDGTIAGLAQLTQGATARTTAGSSNADANVTTLNGLVASGSPAITVNGIGALYGAASLVSSATSVTTGDSATDTANASQALTTAIGLDLTGATASSIGGAAAITGQAEVVGSANASATTGNSSAVSNGGTLSGIVLSIASPLQGNSAAVVNAAASGVLSARATTTSGGSTANVDGNVFGVNGGMGAISIGANGVLNASALLDATAIASTIDGLGNNADASITPGSGIITGLQISNTTAGLSFNGNSTLIGSAQTNQLASASTVSSGNATATVISNFAPIVGVDGADSKINVAGNSQDFIASSLANVNASASSVSGNVKAVDGLATATGLSGGATRLEVKVNGDSLGRFIASANATDTIVASSTSGNAESGLAQSSVFGSSASNITIGGSGMVTATGNREITQLAQSTSGSQSVVNDPSAFGLVNVSGLYDGNVSIGSNGSIETSATSTLSQRALNLGGNSDAFTASVARGTDLSAPNEHLSIGGSGSITSKAVNNGLVEASTVSGNSTAATQGSPYEIKSIGSILQENSSFSIQGTGNIMSEASIGSLTSPFHFKATSVSGNATASERGGDFGNTIGFDGDSDGALTSAQKSTLSSASGIIKSTATSQLQFTASSTSGHSLAGTFLDTAGSGDSVFATSGARDARMVIGSANNSQAVGSAVSTLGAVATSTGGNADSRLEIQSSGILSREDRDATIQASNITGLSQLTATSLATTVLGNSNATSISDRRLGLDNLTGVGNYQLNSLGSGTFSASSSALMKSLANSVTGNSTGITTL